MKKSQNLKVLAILKRTQEMSERITRQKYSYDEDHQTLSRFREQAQQLNDLLLEAEVVKALGTLHAMARKYEAAETYYTQASLLFLSQSDLNGYISTRSNIGVVNEMSYEREKAIEIYRATLQKIDLENLEAEYFSVTLTLLSNLAIALQRSDRDDEAEPYYRMVIDLLGHRLTPQVEKRKLGESATMARNGLANVYRKRGDYPNAWIQARLGYEIAQSVQIPLRVFYALNTMLNLALLDPDSPDTPDSYWQQLEAYVDQQESEATLTFLAQIYLEEAEAYQQQGFPHWAQRCARKANAIYTAFGNVAGVMRATALLDNPS